MSEINPAARFWLNPYDAERTRLQEAVVDAALRWRDFLDVEAADDAVFEELLDGLEKAAQALRVYTAPKHKPKKAAERRA